MLERFLLLRHEEKKDSHFPKAGSNFSLHWAVVVSFGVESEVTEDVIVLLSSVLQEACSISRKG